MTIIDDLVGCNRCGSTRGSRVAVAGASRGITDQLPTNDLHRPVISSDNLVRRSIAERHDCPPDVLAQLANDVDVIVVIRVARHLNCPPDVLARLASSKSWQVRYEVAKNPGTPGDCLLALLNDRDKGVRQRCASRRPLPQWLKDHALVHYDPVVRYMATVEEPW